ncbi:MAG: hypothetical protein LUC41_00635, partial [Clostridiales bacterium]|nr:hypothetical protein [Clostridiales bacterium]
MKKYFAVLLSALCAAALLSGCSSPDNGAAADTESSIETDTNIILHDQYAIYDEPMDLLTDLLPAKIRHLSSGGVIPNEYVDDEKEPARYDPSALLGKWRAVDADSGQTTQATDVTVDALFKSDGNIKAITCLPDTIVFGLDVNGNLADSILDMDIYCGTYLVSDFSFRDQGGSSFTSILPFEIQGNTLATGFYDTSVSDSDTVLLAQEMDYLIEWTGWKLTLTYGNETATYVPRDYLDDGDVLNGGDIIAGYDGIDGITNVDPAGSTVSYGD